MKTFTPDEVYEASKTFYVCEHEPNINFPEEYYKQYWKSDVYPGCIIEIEEDSFRGRTTSGYINNETVLYKANSLTSNILNLIKIFMNDKQQKEGKNESDVVMTSL